MTFKRAIVIASSSVATLAASALPAFALPPAQSVNPCPPGTTFGKLCNINSSNIGGVLSNFVLFLFIVAALIALFFLSWGGIKWILSGGDKAKVDAARSTIVGALIGLALVFGAYFLLNIIFNIFLGQGVGGFNLPKF